MKSTKRKTIKKQNVLLALDRSIASIKGIELAMLFSHAGFEVRTILLDKAEEYISPSALKEITAHSPWSISYKPGWIKADINYVTGILITSEALPAALIQSSIDSNQETAGENDTFFTYFLSHCQSLKIITTKELLECIQKSSEKLQVLELPDNLLKLHIIFEQILAATVKLSASKAFNQEVVYSQKGNLNGIAYINELNNTFAEYGIINKDLKEDSPSDTESSLKNSLYQPRLIISNSTKQIEVILENENLVQPDSTMIYLNKHKNGLILTDNTGTRLLPDFSSKSCFSRLVEYLLVELTRE